MNSFFRKLLSLAASCVAMALAPHGVVHAQGVAMALDRAGDVDVSAGGKSGRLNVLDYLPAEAELKLAAGASATLVYLATSQEWQFAGPGRYKLQPAQPSTLQGAAPRARGVPAPSAQAMAKMEPAQRERMALGAVVMRATGPLRLVGPNGVDVLGQRPTFLWQAPDQQQVRISVFGEASKTPVVQATVTGNQWRAPADLPPGDYTWRAETVTDPQPAARTGRFTVIADIDERRARIGAEPSGFAQRVARAVQLESEDLPHDALVLWRALAAERPEEESLRQWAK